jgi:DNA-binding beta-propeller fold protein YncE
MMTYNLCLASLVVIFLTCLLAISSHTEALSNSDVKGNLEIIRAVPFNNTSLSSIVVDPLRNLVYVSANPSYPYNYTTSLCADENNTNSLYIPNSISACSAIYVIDGDTGQIENIIRLRHGELILDIDINPHLGKIYAVGEYNYLVNDTDANEDELIQYEDDVVYIIHGNDIQRLRLYGEIEEGKEGDMPSIAVDTSTNTIYAGIRYFMGGREGVFLVDDNRVNRNNTIDIPNLIKFIPLGRTGPDHILIDNKTNTVYASLKHDDFIALIDGSNKIVKEQIILQDPRSMSFNPTNRLLYVASGNSNWFNVINMSTNKVEAANIQISYPIATVANNITDKVYVANCLLCDDFDFTNGTSIYELFSNGSTVTWKTYENIDIEDNGLTINPFTNRLYAIGTDVQSGRSNLYVIDISSQ